MVPNPDLLAAGEKKGRGPRSAGKARLVQGVVGGQLNPTKGSSSSCSDNLGGTYEVLTQSPPKVRVSHKNYFSGFQPSESLYVWWVQDPPKMVVAPGPQN